MQSTNTIYLPEGTNLYTHQVAGHAYDGKSKLGVLKHKNGNIIKPIKENDKRAKKELEFYEEVFTNEDSDPIISELATFLPKFCGTCHMKIGEEETKFLCLEDVCQSFTYPSIVDIKIGAKTFDPEATQAKIDYEKSKYLYRDVLGFRILGMKIFCEENKLYMTKDKKFGKQITPAEMEKTFTLILTKDLHVDYLILSGFLHKLKALENWFKKQRKFAFYSSSLLFVYEGALSSWKKWIISYLKLEDIEGHGETVNVTEYLRNIFHESMSNTSQCKTCFLQSDICSMVISECNLIRLSIIDCAHVFPTLEKDSNYIFGLENVIKYFQLILDKQKLLVFCNN